MKKKEKRRRKSKKRSREESEDEDDDDEKPKKKKRKGRCCKTCKKSMKGHPKGYCPEKELDEDVDTEVLKKHPGIALKGVLNERAGEIIAENNFTKNNVEMDNLNYDEDDEDIEIKEMKKVVNDEEEINEMILEEKEREEYQQKDKMDISDDEGGEYNDENDVKADTEDDDSDFILQNTISNDNPPKHKDFPKRGQRQEFIRPPHQQEFTYPPKQQKQQETTPFDPAACDTPLRNFYPPPCTLYQDKLSGGLQPLIGEYPKIDINKGMFEDDPTMPIVGDSEDEKDDDEEMKEKDDDNTINYIPLNKTG